MSIALQDISLELSDGIQTALDGQVTVNGVDYSVFVTMPKVAPDNYIYIGEVNQIDDGTKDEFIYKGTVQIRVTTDNLHTAEKKLARQIISAVRGLLKPTVDAVFALDTSELIVFSHESYSELTTQTDSNLVRIDLIDIYNFEIQ